ncbi:MAG: hypothetical protein ACLQHS_11470 [Candidatus Limnocylindrales bacterium]
MTEARAGHPSVAFTYDRNVHLFPEADTTAAAKLEAIHIAKFATESDSQPL